eukprot:CAMPEP_0182592052 /NCGR_PEP_ID=MMETSP1324-20130603/75151_1 /TAXON_ID=236786 /ORGANISM="Florenciella sp., Strain RCC1587" /LENGTH=97 /DNA_ID=CAMNT_0024809413 /DNA_START=56 /DNA_END=351 /DNA_ORIENTATION=+
MVVACGRQNRELDGGAAPPGRGCLRVYSATSPPTNTSILPGQTIPSPSAASAPNGLRRVMRVGTDWADGEASHVATAPTNAAEVPTWCEVTAEVLQI